MLIVLLSAFLVTASPAADAGFRSQIQEKLTAKVAETKSLHWLQKTWATKGDEVEKTSAECFWSMPDKTRLNVKEGRGAGATAIYQAGKVTGFQPGLFSFVKLTYDVRDKEVLGLRGGDIRQNGFMDDFSLILAQWREVQLEPLNHSTVVVSYRNIAGLPTKMWLAADSLEPVKIESYENGKAVERAEFEKIAYNPTLDAKLFEP